MTWLSVDLPEPFGPMMACTSPLLTVSDRPWRISRSSTRTCRFLTSSNGITLFRFLGTHPAERRRRVSERGPNCHSMLRDDHAAPSQHEALSDRTFQRDRDKL